MGYAIAAVLGAFIATGELVSRYRDSPRRTLLGSAAAWFYCAINAAASVAALGLSRIFDIKFGQQGEAVEWVRVMVAGLGAMAFFRSSIFTVRAGEHDLGIGPISFLQVMLGAIDRAVDRRRASGRAVEIGKLVEGLSFAKSFVSLPTYCLALMQNMSPEDQKSLAQSIVTLKDIDMPESVKLRILAVYLMNAVGPDALESAVESLRKDLAG